LSYPDRSQVNNSQRFSYVIVLRTIFTDLLSFETGGSNIQSNHIKRQNIEQLQGFPLQGGNQGKVQADFLYVVEITSLMRYGRVVYTELVIKKVLKEIQEYENESSHDVWPK
jgi:hypothetical protein